MDKTRMAQLWQRGQVRHVPWKEVVLDCCDDQFKKGTGD